MIKEIWRDIKDYEGLYQISNLGRVKSFYRYKGTIERFLNPSIHKGCRSIGSLYLNLKKNGNRKHFYIHRFVLEAFISPRPSGMECRHLDGNPKNNKLDNVCWGSHQENENDKIIHKTKPLGFKHWNSKLTEMNIPEIRKYIKEGFSNTKIGKIFNVNRQTIRDIRLNKTWKHIK